jgi:hypothetical protein
MFDFFLMFAIDRVYARIKKAFAGLCELTALVNNVHGSHWWRGNQQIVAVVTMAGN